MKNNFSNETYIDSDRSLDVLLDEMIKFKNKDLVFHELYAKTDEKLETICHRK